MSYDIALWIAIFIVSYLTKIEHIYQQYTNDKMVEGKKKMGFADKPYFLIEKETFEFPKHITTSKLKSGKDQLRGHQIFAWIADDEKSQDEPVRIEEEWWIGTNSMLPRVGVIETKSGVIDGKIQISRQLIKKEMNVGKVNQNNILLKTLHEAEKKYNERQKKSVVVKDRYPPMMFQRKPDMDEKAAYYVSAKVNGHRGVAHLDEDGKVEFYSRSLTVYPFTGYVTEQTQKILEENEGLYLDGELYIHGQRLQKIYSHARKKAFTGDLQFWIFDVFDPKRENMTFEDRNVILMDLEKRYGELSHIRFIRHEKIDGSDIKRAYELMDKYVSEDLEGVVIRKADDGYTYSFNDRRTGSSFKLKPRQDAEFKIAGFTKGEVGKCNNCIIWILETENGVRFNAVPSMGIEERKKLYEELEDNRAKFSLEYEGRLMTVSYFELSEAGVPLQPTAEGLRLAE